MSYLQQPIVKRSLLLAIAGTLLTLLPASERDVAAAPLPVYNTIGIDTNYTVNVESYQDSNFRGIVRQNFDFSCGSAALATLLRYHYDWPVDESIVLDAMFAVGDQEKIRREGFSLLDMKQYLSALGFAADGYKQSLDKLSRVGIPAIVLINSNGYLHFVVVKGVTSEKVLLGDPALGLRSLPREEFESMWNGILFVIRDDLELARHTFNRKGDWRIRQKAQFSTAMEQGLSRFSLDITPTPGYY